jgi:hypothetical protein
MRKSSHITAFEASPVIAEWLAQGSKKEIEQQLPRMLHLREGAHGFLALLPTETVLFREYEIQIGGGKKLLKEYPIKQVNWNREQVASLYETNGLIPFSFVIIEDAARELGLRLLR